MFPWWLNGKESTCQCRRHRLDPEVGKSPRRRKWHPTPVFLPGKSHGWRSLVGYSPCGHKRVGHNLATRQQKLTRTGRSRRRSSPGNWPGARARNEKRPVQPRKAEQGKASPANIQHLPGRQAKAEQVGSDRARSLDFVLRTMIKEEF